MPPVGPAHIARIKATKTVASVYNLSAAYFSETQAEMVEAIKRDLDKIEQESKRLDKKEQE